MTEPYVRPSYCRCSPMPVVDPTRYAGTSRYARAMAAAPLGDDATARQREKARTDNEARTEAIRMERAALLAEATADWTAFRDRLACNPPALAALELHQPEAGHWVCCTRCGGHADPEEWPCDTYQAMKTATQ